MLGSEEGRAQIIDRAAREACAFGRLFLTRVKEIRHRTQRAGGLALALPTLVLPVTTLRRPDSTIPGDRPERVGLRQAAAK